MKDLTPRQRTLVDTLVATDCSIKEAARIAGYSGGNGGEAARVTGSKTLRLPHVQQYMRQQIMETFGLAAPLALKRMISLLDADSEHVQLEASKQLLDRAGFTRTREDPKQVINIGFRFDF